MKYRVDTLDRFENKYKQFGKAEKKLIIAFTRMSVDIRHFNLQFCV